MVMVDEKEAPGFKVAGIDPPVAEKPPPVTETPSVERPAGMLPAFFTVYEITTLSPGVKGPAVKLAALIDKNLPDGNGVELLAELRSQIPDTALLIEVTRRFGAGEPPLSVDHA
jgi:hypothetical protein